jgi:rubrerythrin
MSEDLLVLREILQRELETINAYERMLARIADDSLRQIILHVTDEEREHVAEMYHLIMERDPLQRARSERGQAQIAGMHAATPQKEAQTAAAAAGLGADALISQADPVGFGKASPGEAVFPDGAWSVGSMKGRST